MEKTYSNKSGKWMYQYNRGGSWFTTHSVPVAVLQAAAYYKCGYITFDSWKNEAFPSEGAPCGLFKGAGFKKSRGYRAFCSTREVAADSKEARQALEIAAGVIVTAALIDALIDALKK